MSGRTPGEPGQRALGATRPGQAVMRAVMRAALLTAALTAVLAAALMAALGWPWAGQPAPTAPSPGTAHGVADTREPSSPGLVARGAYLARLGHCAGCHTAPGGADYAGGRALPTPFGNVYGGNLTPDNETGLGRWTADDLWQALHHGRGAGGRRLLPAFPYTAYTHVRREDSDALYAYLRSLPAVRQPNRPHELRFPYNTAWALAAWQWLYFKPADAALQTPLTRGAYLVRGLGHCSACHAPRNGWGAEAAALSGADMPGQPWHAPSLHPDPARPTTAADLVALLRVGMSRHGSAVGPMAAVVFGSTQHWSDEDLEATAGYLLSLPPQRRDAEASGASTSPAAPAIHEAGRQVYAEHCADCHGAQGRGVAGVYPPLAGNATVLQPSARNLVQVIQRGSFAPATAGNPRPYGMGPQDLSDAEMAAVTTYLRQAWGHRAPAVSEIEVIRLR